MDWVRILAYVTGMVDQELLTRNEYFAAENRILKAQLKGRLQLSNASSAHSNSVKESGPVVRDASSPPALSEAAAMKVTLTLTKKGETSGVASNSVRSIGPRAWEN